MNEYLLLIHGNAKTPISSSEWQEFFAVARHSGAFLGGSQIGWREILGETKSAPTSMHIAGYMRFKSDSLPLLRELLESHPVVVHGGSMELCELPKT